LSIVQTFLIVDGYNIINAWEGLKTLSEENLEQARDALVTTIENYIQLKGYRGIVVFDAYNNDEGIVETSRGNLKVVYTKKNQTADSYIERLIQEIERVHEVYVATSDFMIQRMVMSAGGIRMSARELQIDIQYAQKTSAEKVKKEIEQQADRLSERLDEQTAKRLVDLFQNKNK